MSGMPRRFGPVVLLLVISLMPAAIPCADDLAVDAGAPDRCLAAASSDDGPEAAPSVCPCICHVALGVVAIVRVAPSTLVAELHAPEPAADLPAVPAPITHPPLV
jgi:hypothetical protein